MTNSKSADRFYNDIDPAFVAMAVPSLALQAWTAFLSPMGFAAARLPVKKTYLLCEKDQCVPPQLQLSMAEKAGAEIVKIPFGHSPFLRDDGLDVIVESIRNLCQEH